MFNPPKRSFLIIALVLCCLTVINHLPALAQQAGNNDLTGDMELVIDISEMKDIAGRFMVMVGGEIFYPSPQNNQLILKKNMDEPRRSHICFYPEKVLEANPGKALNEIAAAYSDAYDFLAMPGQHRMRVKDTVAGIAMESAGRYQKEYEDLNSKESDFFVRFMEHNPQLALKIRKEKGGPVFDSLMAIIRISHEKFYKETILEYIRMHPDSPVSVFHLDEYSSREDRDFNLLESLYNNLSDRMKALPTARRVNNRISQASLGRQLIGKTAPDFAQNDTAGKVITLKDFRGSITLLDFWAGWCGACRAANPEIVKVYNRFKDKGFRILSVSLDEKRDDWLDAIRKDQLNWTHVSDLKFWDNEVAQLYQIKSIPSNYLIDADGKVLAANFEAKELESILNEYLLTK